MAKDAVLCSRPDKELLGVVELDGSKSISNRLLLIQALGGFPLGAPGLSKADDTRILRQLLMDGPSVYNAGDSGTAYRFLTAFLCTRPGSQVLTGSARMLERPVGPLVNALRQLGADITYLGRQGFPPLRIGSFGVAHPEVVTIEAGVSSQFISAIVMIAPLLGGLELELSGKLVSASYLEMTVRVMRHFGVEVTWIGNRLSVSSGPYRNRFFEVEPDWSAASYWYGMAVFSDRADLFLPGLIENSWQGDAVLCRMMEVFGITTKFMGGGVRIVKQKSKLPATFDWNFMDCPDLAQTLAVICGGVGVQGEFSGLSTLGIKETDRIEALRVELDKLGVKFRPVAGEEKGEMRYQVRGKAVMNELVSVATYGDHRMALSFATLSMLGEVEICHASVVSKSYPRYWIDMEKLGFSVQRF
jgi:3-phosphoshikimate 1-carboxyvinyltransferase